MMLQTSVISKAALEAVGRLDVRFRLIHDSYLFCRLGIRGPACAVAGIGCVQTSDDTSNVRLTVEIPLTSVGKAVEDCEMWSDILRHRQALPPEFIRLVRFNTASCYCQTGRGLIRAGKYLRGWSTFLRGLAIDLRFTGWLLRHGTANGYERTVRPALSEYHPA
jgi:hypothetical protein